MRGLSAPRNPLLYISECFEGFREVPAAERLDLPGPTPRPPSFHALSSILRI